MQYIKITIQIESCLNRVNNELLYCHDIRLFFTSRSIWFGLITFVDRMSIMLPYLYVFLNKADFLGYYVSNDDRKNRSIFVFYIWSIDPLSTTHRTKWTMLSKWSYQKQLLLSWSCIKWSMCCDVVQLPFGILPPSAKAGCRHCRLLAPHWSDHRWPSDTLCWNWIRPFWTAR